MLNVIFDCTQVVLRIVNHESIVRMDPVVTQGIRVMRTHIHRVRNFVRNMLESLNVKL